MTGESGKPDENTVLLLHFDGNFKDECGNAVTSNNAVLTTDGRFTGGVMFGANSYLTFSNDAELHRLLESGVFTLECWVKPDTLLGEGIIFAIWENATNSGLIQTGYTTWLNWGDYLAIYGYQPFVSGNNSLTVGQFNHFAIVGDGVSTKYYTHGMIRMDAPKMPVDNYKNNPFTLGKSIQSMQGVISEFRVSNVARWTSNFTPPTKPY
ncbi:LamG-like jellyroll fold domain-containing protein [Parabacteroides provencensis]|uniref:LamG-like jellyroll fold domain-containing protein n=1 Tax=Parabacteroides provencensis TaxID=1944636 RepID=UPI00130464E6|nr:LamG-like jellyroll fold domain-containing protein [Parabacteroides provencensis]